MRFPVHLFCFSSGCCLQWTLHS